jgi:cytochrome c-type biogenesis protein
MRRSLALLALVLFCVAAVAHPFQRGAEKGGEKKSGLLSVGDAAPDWTLADPQGRTHKLSEYRGSVVVLDFWATWCGPCAKVMPRLEKLQKKYGERGLVVFGVSSWDTGDPVALMKKRGITYTLLLKGEEMAPDYGVTSLPVVYVIGAGGRVVYSHAGADPKDLSDLIEKNLGQGS